MFSFDTAGLLVTSAYLSLVESDLSRDIDSCYKYIASAKCLIVTIVDLLLHCNHGNHVTMLPTFDPELYVNQSQLVFKLADDAGVAATVRQLWFAQSKAQVCRARRHRRSASVTLSRPSSSSLSSCRMWTVLGSVSSWSHVTVGSSVE